MLLSFPVIIIPPKQVEQLSKCKKDRSLKLTIDRDVLWPKSYLSILPARVRRKSISDISWPKSYLSLLPARVYDVFTQYPDFFVDARTYFRSRGAQFSSCLLVWKKKVADLLFPGLGIRAVGNIQSLSVVNVLEHDQERLPFLVVSKDSICLCRAAILRIFG
jgi:hypothetical protein